MLTDHRRPLTAYGFVALACALVLWQPTLGSTMAGSPPVVKLLTETGVISSEVLRPVTGVEPDVVQVAAPVGELPIGGYEGVAVPDVDPVVDSSDPTASVDADGPGRGPAVPDDTDRGSAVDSEKGPKDEGPDHPGQGPTDKGPDHPGKGPKDKGPDHPGKGPQGKGHERPDHPGKGPAAKVASHPGKGHPAADHSGKGSKDKGAKGHGSRGKGPDKGAKGHGPKDKGPKGKAHQRRGHPGKGPRGKG